jgi:hypothetical protein
MSLILDTIEALRPSHPDLARRLADAVLQVQAGEPVLEALELTAESMRAERDRYLRQAYIVSGRTAWGAAGAIADHLAGRHRGRLYGPVLALVDAAAQCCRIPETQRRIYSILIEGGTDAGIQRACATDHREGIAGVTDRAA